MYILPNGLKCKRFATYSKPITEMTDLLVNPLYFPTKTTWNQPNDYSLIACNYAVLHDTRFKIVTKQLVLK